MNAKKIVPANPVTVSADMADKDSNAKTAKRKTATIGSKHRKTAGLNHS